MRVTIKTKTINLLSCYKFGFEGLPFYCSVNQKCSGHFPFQIAASATTPTPGSPTRKPLSPPWPASSTSPPKPCASWSACRRRCRGWKRARGSVFCIAHPAASAMLKPQSQPQYPQPQQCPIPQSSQPMRGKSSQPTSPSPNATATSPCRSQCSWSSFLVSCGGRYSIQFIGFLEA